MAQRSKSNKRSLASVPALSVAQRRALSRLSTSGLADELYLAGGVAVAHHLAHRRSNDLDLFSRRSRLDLERVRQRFVSELGAEIVEQSDAALKARVGGAMIDVVRYPYRPLVLPKRGPEGVLVAGLRDLAVMKLAAIARRGARRDFWDLHEILTRSRLSLHRVCEDYMQKFGVSEADLYHVLRSLNWFEDADRDPTPPRGLSHSKWREIRAWFERSAPQELLKRAK